MADLGNAYVNIIPKAPGIEKELKSLLGDGAAGAGSPAGKAAGSSFMSAFKKIVAGAAVGKVLKDAFSAGGEYQQLAGGVEKIFAGMDTSRIINDAAKAYKNLNLSANDYLAVINDVGASFAVSMGAEAGYETAQKGLQAIADYASGTGKNVETLSQKFTMITRSTSSYMSIADQFSGILPATSANFLAQAKAAGFLSNSYKELTQVPIDEYQAAVASMLEKGVEGLNLTGNTAKEASTTLTGSLASVEASWENVLAAMTTGEGLDGAVAGLSESVSGLLGTAVNALDSFAPQIPTLITGIGQILADNVDDILANGVYIAVKMADGLLKGIPHFAENWPAFKEELGASFEELDWSFLGTGLIGDMLEGLKSAWENVKTWWSGVKDSLSPGRATIDIVERHSSPNGGAGFIGSHATGLNYVPFNNYPALLHQGEMVVPRSLASQMRAAGISKDSRNLDTLRGGVIVSQQPQKIVIEFTGSLAQLGRVLQPHIKAEEQRRGPQYVN